MTSLPFHTKMSNETLTMKAVLWEGTPYQMVVKEVPRPTIQAPTDVIVRVTTAAICGSDLHNYHGILGGPKVPFQMGHEAVGIVDQVGSSVQTFKKGDRVIVPDSYEIGTQLFLYGEGNLSDGGETLQSIGGCQGKRSISSPSLSRSAHHICLQPNMCEYWTVTRFSSPSHKA
jgi:threonine dehydrogenase-like Zn-dependent dehydrogenase